MTLSIAHDRVVWQDAGGEVIALDLRSSEYLRLNPTAAVLWERLETGADRQDLIDTLVDTYGIDEDEASADVDAFTRQLVAQGLLASGT